MVISLRIFSQLKKKRDKLCFIQNNEKVSLTNRYFTKLNLLSREKIRKRILRGGGCRGLMDRALSRQPGGQRFKSILLLFFPIDQSDRVEKEVKRNSGKRSTWKCRIETEG